MKNTIKEAKQNFMQRFREINAELNELEKAHTTNIKRVRQLQIEIRSLEHQAKVLFNV